MRRWLALGVGAVVVGGSVGGGCLAGGASWTGAVLAAVGVAAAVLAGARAVGVAVRFALRGVERRYGYDTTYLAALLRDDPAGFYKFALVGLAANHRAAAPVEAYYAAKIVAAMAEDCGPCTQLMVAMAREAGVPGDQVAAVLGRRTEAMSDATARGFAFADAVIGRRPEADAARDAVREAWGDRAVSALTLGMAVGRTFPMVKAGLGYARECRLVVVDGEAVPVVRAP